MYNYSSMNKEALEKLTHFTEHFEILCLRLYSQYLFLRPMMVNDYLVARMGNEGKRYGFERLRELLYWNLIQEIVKLTLDDDDRSPSLKNFLKKFESEYLKSELCKRAEHNGSVNFDKNYKRLFSEATSLVESDTLKGFLAVRDKLISHNELRKDEEKYSFLDVGTLNLKYGDERKAVEKLEEISKLMSSIVLNLSRSWETYIEQEKADVCKFWELDEIELSSEYNSE